MTQRNASLPRIERAYAPDRERCALAVLAPLTKTTDLGLQPRPADDIPPVKEEPCHSRVSADEVPRVKPRPPRRSASTSIDSTDAGPRSGAADGGSHGVS
jgi:hypothetical protein